MGKRGAGDFTQKKDSIPDIWERWGLATYGEKGGVGELTYEGLHDSRGRGG